jgi:hypothetical protein
LSGLPGRLSQAQSSLGTDGEVANALVCKTSIHGFKSHSVLQQNKALTLNPRKHKRPL